MVPVIFSLGTIPKITTGYTQTLLNYFDAVFHHKSIIFCHNITSITKQLPNMEPWLSDFSNDICFIKITKRFDFLKHEPQNHRVYIYVCFYILIYTTGGYAVLNDEWMMHLYSAFIVYCHTPKALYNHVGGGCLSSTTTKCFLWDEQRM